MSSSGSESIVKRILRFHRRRLTIVSDNPLIDGYDPSTYKNLDDEGSGDGHPIQRCLSSVAHDLTPPVGSLSYKSVKGKAPYNLRKQNQDAYIIAQDSQTSAILLVVLDGHGEDGHKVSSTFRKKLPSMVFSHSAWPNDVRKAVGESIVSIEKTILKDRMVETDFSGTTLVAVVIQGRHATVANIGDSRVILGKRNNEDEKGSLLAEELSFDHKPDLPEEKVRILEAGGRVFAMQYQDGEIGPQRVWLGQRDLPGLAMSRSLCDTVAHSVGVLSEPNWYEYDLDPVSHGNDCFIMLASDGLWEYMTSEECVAIAEMYSKPKDAINALIAESTSRWLVDDQVVDDTTIVLAFLGDWMVQKK